MSRARESGELGRVGRLAARVKLALVMTAAALVVAAIAAAISVAVLLPEDAVHEPGSWIPLLLGAAVVAASVLVALVARRYVAASSEPALVPEVERSVGLRRGQLAGALELAVPTRGGSATLGRLGRDRVADQLASREDWELFPDTLRWIGRRISVAGILFTIAIVGLAVLAARAPARTAKAAEALGRPWTTAFPPPPPRIRVAPGDTAVLRGDRLEVRAMAPQRDSVSLAWQAEGEPIRRLTVAVDEDGGARGETGPVESSTTYWVEGDDGSSSARHEVRPLDPLLVTELSVELRYPSYLERPTETLGSIGGDLELPAGTLVRIRGRANAGLEAASLRDTARGASVRLEVEGDRFAADWRPTRDGTWAWTFEPAGELPGVRPPPEFGVRVVPDLRPEIRITFPGRDTAASVDLRLPLVVDAQDDIGLAVVDLETWRVSGAGLRGEPRVVPLWSAASARERLDRMVLRPLLRLDVLELVPGDTLFYTARAGDGNPGRAVSRSDTFRVYVPTISELRRSASETAGDLARSGRELKDDAADLARAARDAERRTGGRDGSSQEGGNEFEATEEARRVLERGEDLNERVGEMRQQMEEMQDGAEDSGMADAAMREKMEQLEELFRQIEETGLGEKLRQLEEALRDLDQPRTRQELGELSNTLRELEERLERTLSLMERVATEQSMKEAVESAQELADQQSALAESYEGSGDWADRQEDVAEQAERLEAQMEELRERLAQQGLDAAADSVGRGQQQANQASGDMQDAAQQARAGEQGGQQQGGQQQGGAQSAAQAAGQMQQAAASMQQAGQTLNEDWKREALEAVERATGEALDLAGEQQQVADALSQSGVDPAALSGRQAALVQGLDQLLSSLAEAGRKTALIDETVGRSAANARRSMQALGEALGAREGPPRTAAGDARALVETLNELAGRLMASREQVENAGSATGMEEALDQMARLSQSQAGLNRESGGLMMMQQSGQPMAAQMRRLAERQQEIARELEQLAERPEARELPGRPELLSDEAEEIAAQLRSGQLDQATLQRQERLFRRLLDAGRSLERDEDPSRRESEAADLSRPGALPEALGVIESGPRFPYPDDAALTGVSNSFRRLILQYFDRLNADDGPPGTEGSPAAGSPAGGAAEGGAP